MVVPARRYRFRAFLTLLFPIFFIAYIHDIRFGLTLDINRLVRFPDSIAARIRSSNAIHGGSSGKDTEGTVGMPSENILVTSKGDGKADSFAFLETRPTRGGVLPSDAMLQFWKNLLKAMMDARPKTDNTVIIGEPVTEDDFQPNPLLDNSRSRIDKTHLADDLRDAITAAHAEFAKVARILGHVLPYSGKDDDVRGSRVKAESPASDRGQLSPNKAAQKTTKRDALREGTTKKPTEQQLPADATPTMERMLFSTDDAPIRGIVMTAGGPYVGVAVTSLLMLRRSGSTLPVQLFLDSDSDYNRNLCEEVLPGLGAECHIMQRFWEATPDMPKLAKFQFKVFAILFSSYREILFLDADCWPIHKPDELFDSEPFTSRGLVTWPDFWLSTAAPVLYDIFGIPAPALTERRSSESGILLYDKARHSTSLLLAAYYNFYGPGYYYPLLSQGAAGEGDKETFLHGAMVAGNPFYSVHTQIRILGRTINGTFIGAAMRQADPAEDFKLVQKKEAEKGEEAQQKDRAETVQARSMFVHHNLFKIDLRNLGHSMKDVYAVDERGLPSRLWDVEKKFNDDAGYDVEKTMWNEIHKAVCSGRSSTANDCVGFQKYYAAVFS